MTAPTYLETLQTLIEELKAERKLAEKMHDASVLQLRAQLRAQVVEECARVVEMQEPISQVHRSPYGFGYFKCREDAAAAIRALALPRGSEGK